MTGALDSYDVSVYYIRSWPIWPFRTSSSLLISSPEILSLSNTTTKLHLLLIHIEEVTSVSVEGEGILYCTVGRKTHSFLVDIMMCVLELFSCY